MIIPISEPGFPERFKSKGCYIHEYLLRKILLHSKKSLMITNETAIDILGINGSFRIEKKQDYYK